jgi:AcrR family transcriptional regulator
MAKPVKRTPLTRARVLEAAFSVVEREGLEGISMRRVGEALGVEAMSLYNHIDGKAALLDGLFEAVLARLPAPPTRKSPSWRSALKERANALRQVLLANPRFLPLFATRPAVTPGSIAHVESVLQVLHDAGFSSHDCLNALQVTVSFVVGHALGSAAALQASEDASFPDYSALDAAAFPRVHELAKLLPRHDSDVEFRFGLEVLCDGLAKRLE